MKTKYFPPAHSIDEFNCPFCDVYAEQTWCWLNAYTFSGNEPRGRLDRLSIAVCHRCKRLSVWHDDKMLYPISSSAPMPVDDMPEEVKNDYLEARNVVNNSPRSACALLRLGLQKLMVSLEEKGKDLNDDIGNLVKKGLPAKIQKALDSVRVIGNSAVHPGELDLRDDIGTAVGLFELTNMIVEVMIRQPKEVEKIFEKIPAGAKEAIKKRDQT